jgi:HSP20 family protein
MSHVRVWSLYWSPEPEAAEAWQPPVDVYRGRCGWLLKFDLAGVRPEDVQVRISGSRITVSGVRRDWVLEQGYVHHSMEISYNRFERTINLPGDLCNAEFSLESIHGLLLVRVNLA